MESLIRLILKVSHAARSSGCWIQYSILSDLVIATSDILHAFREYTDHLPRTVGGMSILDQYNCQIPQNHGTTVPESTTSDIRIYLQNAFSLACSDGRADIVRVLLREFPGMDIERTNIFGDTPFQIAVRNNRSEIAELILTDSRCIDFKGKVSDALVFASDRGHCGMVDTLFKIIVLKKVDLYEIVGYNSMSFILACQNGHLGVVKSFLSQLHEYDSETIHTFGVLGMLAACRVGRIEIVDLLLKNGVSVNCEFDQTPLIAASENGHLDIVNRLLQEDDIDINLRDSEGCTAVMMARSNNHVKLEDLLLGLPDIDTDFAATFTKSKCRYKYCDFY